MTSHGTSGIWISRILESQFPVRIRNHLVASVLKLNLLTNVGFVLFYVSKRGYITTGVLLASILVMIWVNAGPYLIWYYDKKLFPTFFDKASNLCCDSVVLNALEAKYSRLFRQKYWVVTIPWTALVVSPLVLDLSMLLKVGIFGTSDLWYWLDAIGLVWVSLLTSIGFWGVLITIFVVHELSKQTISIHPLHPDKVGGLSCVGYFAIGTTLLFSSGSLFIPFTLHFMSPEGTAPPNAYLAIAALSFFILLSFLYPTVRINRKAKSTRDRILDVLGKRYIKLDSSIELCEQIEKKGAASYLELFRLRSEYQDYKEMKLYPFEIEIFVKLVSSVIFPLLLTLLEVYLPRIV